MVLPSLAYTQWHKDASLQLCGKKVRIGDVKQMTLTFFAPDKRKADMTNKAESVMDLLVDNGILEDDNWFVVGDLQMKFGGVDSENPRVEIVIN